VEYCPYVPGLYSNVNWHVFVDGLQNGNKAVHPKKGPTFVSDMMPEMLAKTGFFEGNVFFGVDPHWAAAIHRLVEQYNPRPYEPFFSPHAWDYVHQKISKEGTECKDIKRKHTYKEELAPGIMAYVAPGDIAPWGWDQWGGGDPYTPKTLSKTSQFSGWPGRDKKLEEYLKTGVNAWALFVNNTDEKFRLGPDATLKDMPFDKYVTHIPKDESYGRYLPGRKALKQIA